MGNKVRFTVESLETHEEVPVSGELTRRFLYNVDNALRRFLSDLTKRFEERGYTVVRSDETIIIKDARDYDSFDDDYDEIINSGMWGKIIREIKNEMEGLGIDAKLVDATGAFHEFYIVFLNPGIAEIAYYVISENWLNNDYYFGLSKYYARIEGEYNRQLLEGLTDNFIIGISQAHMARIGRDCECDCYCYDCSECGDY